MPGKTWIPEWSSLQDPTPKRLQDSAQTFRQGFLNGIADGILVNVVMTSQKAIINHNLGRAPQGFIVVYKTQQEDIWFAPSQPTTIDSTKQVQLQTNVSPTSTAPIQFMAWFF